MNSKSKKQIRKLQHNAQMVKSPSRTTPSCSQQMHRPSQAKEISPPVERAFANWMKENFGTDDKVLQSKLLRQAVQSLPDLSGKEMESFNCVAASFHGIAPKDSLEGMLGVQMFAVHAFAMECVRRAALDGQTNRSLRQPGHQASPGIRKPHRSSQSVQGKRGAENDSRARSRIPRWAGNPGTT
jgi:hypothetical protein